MLNIRKTAFWLIDSLKGGTLRSHYKDVKDNLTYFEDDGNIQKRKLYQEELLVHARNSSPFYNDVKGNSITDFPVINKRIVRDKFENFRSTSEQFKCASTVVTSGSTGTPFSVEIDRRKQWRNTADTIFFGELAGFEIGHKLYLFKIWNQINRKSWITAFMQNIVPYDVRNLGEKDLAKMIERMKKDRSKKAFLAYASVYDEIVAYLSTTTYSPLDCNLQAIIAASESFSHVTKEKMSEIFGVGAVSRYSNVENGIIAQQLPGGSGEFLINEASYFVEILEQNSDTPVIEGKPGRIIITDLFNYRMPLIRYDTGDIGILESREIFGATRQVFTSIEGRRMDLIYDTAGFLVSSYVITNNMWKYMEIKQYQFIQTSEKEYLFKLNTDMPFDREREIISEFTNYFGQDSTISVEYVSEIPLLASGKRKKVMNSWKNP